MALRFTFAHLFCLVEPETAMFAAVLVAGGRLAGVVTAAAGTFQHALSTSSEEERNSFVPPFQLLTHLRGNPCGPLHASTFQVRVESIQQRWVD